MKIAEYAVQQNSTHSIQEENRQQESLTYWRNGEEQTVISGAKAGAELKNVQASLGHVAEKVQLSDDAVKTRSVDAVNDSSSDDPEVMHDLNMMILKEMIERITGKKIRMIDPASFSASEKGQVEATAAIPDSSNESTESESEGYGLIYQYNQSHHEYEASSFQASGVVKTSDGREIDIAVAINMSREFSSEHNVTIRAGDALKDPLILNFGGTAAELTQRSFEFDIDSDGKADQISFVGEQSGFLAYDKNGDGVINNGSELFGPESGNGFEELSQYDDDGNNWIDENDAIYQNLRIWQKNGNETTLVSLGEKGVGAIYLGSIDTQFSLKDSRNQLLGEVRSGSVFLNEDGSAGTIQQIDLVA